MMFQDNSNNKQITDSAMFGRGACGESIGGFVYPSLIPKSFTLNTAGLLTIEILNPYGQTILIDAIELGTNPVTSTSNWSIDPPSTVINGTSEAIGSVGGCYSYDLTIYDTRDDIEFISVGKVSGTYK